MVILFLRQHHIKARDHRHRRRLLLVINHECISAIMSLSVYEQCYPVSLTRRREALGGFPSSARRLEFRPTRRGKRCVWLSLCLSFIYFPS